VNVLEACQGSNVAVLAVTVGRLPAHRYHRSGTRQSPCMEYGNLHQTDFVCWFKTSITPRSAQPSTDNAMVRLLKVSEVPPKREKQEMSTGIRSYGPLLGIDARR
jgi:hypothetical protein